MMIINVELLAILSELFKSIPYHTPNRITLIHEFANVIWNSIKDVCCKKCCVINVSNESDYNKCSEFVLSIENIMKIHQDIPIINHAFDIDFDNIILPQIYFCCSKILKIIPYYASLPLYTTRGLKKCRLYHSKCSVCKTNYYPGFSEDKNENKKKFSPISELEILAFNSGVAFTKELMKQFDNMICIGALSFEKISDIYKSNQA